MANYFNQKTSPNFIETPDPSTVLRVLEPTNLPIRIAVMPNNYAARLVPGRHKWAAIQVTTPGSGFPPLPTENQVGCLQLKFWDLEEPLTTGKKNSNDIDSPLILEIGEEDLFTEDQARQILSFVNRVLMYRAKILVIHCEAGASRSPAIAAALIKYFGQDDSFIFKPGSGYSPNKRVYGLLGKVASDYPKVEKVDFDFLSE